MVCSLLLLRFIIALQAAFGSLLSPSQEGSVNYPGLCHTSPKRRRHFSILAALSRTFHRRSSSAGHHLALPQLGHSGNNLHGGERAPLLCCNVPTSPRI